MAASEGGGRTGSNAQPADEEGPKMEEDCYKMDSEPRGLCYIFNNKHFDRRKPRIGTEKDRDRLEKVWKTLQFEVKTFDDLKKQEMEEKLQELATLDVHKDNDCVVVFFLTHGENGAVQGTDNEWLTFDSIISPFKVARCPSLAGKPKLFFFQSCRGKEFQKVQSNVDGGKTPAATKIKSEDDKMVLTEVDFFLGFATVAGTQSLRNPEIGSWFIQELVQTLQESADREDLDSLMTTIRRRVTERQSETDDGTFVMQTAESKTTLLKKIYFKGEVSRKNNGSTGHSELDNLISDARNLTIQEDSRKHVSTKAEMSAYILIQQKGSVFIKGKSGSGKSTLGRKILARISREKRRLPIVLSSWNDWNLIPKVNHENHDRDNVAGQKKYVVLIDNIFGSSSLVDSYVDSWVQLFDRIWQNVVSGHVWLVITSRPEICSQCDEKIGKYQLMKTIQCMVLDEEKYDLTREEKLQMVEKICGDKCFSHYQRETIVGMQTVLGFPQCCTFFASSKEAQAKGVEFFRKPQEFVLEEIDRMHENDGMGYLVLLLILMKDGCLSSDHLKLNTYKTELKPLAEDLKECCNKHFDITAASIKSKIKDFLGVYLVKTRNGYQFQHQSIHEVAFISISKQEPEIAMKHCPPKMLVELMHTHQMNKNETVVILPPESFHVLADRITDHLLSESYSVILDHPSLRHEEFVKLLTKRWRETNMLTKVIQTKHETKDVTVSGPSILRHGYCHFKSLTLFHYTSLISDVILQRLTLLLNDILSDVCKEVDAIELLAPALYIQDNQLVRELLDKCKTLPSDCFLALCVSPAIDQAIKERLTQKFNARDIPQPHNVLLVTVLVGNKYLVEYILHHIKGDKNIVSLCQNILQFSSRKWSSSLLNTCQNPITMCEILHMLIALIPANPPLQGITDVDGNTLLHLAVQTENIHYTKMFLEEQHVPHLPLDPNCTQWVNKLGRSPIHLAAESGSSETVKLLLDKGADVSTQDDDGKTPLHMAAPRGSSETVKLLLDHGADVSTQDKDSKTPLHLAATSGSSETVKLLLAQGAHVSTKDRNGDAPLHMAAPRGSSETVKLLLNKGADVSTQDIFRKTPLHLAVECGSSETVKLLLERGADVSTQDDDGKAPLHLAAKSGRSETVKLLLDKGADVSAQDGYRRTPLYMAAMSGSSETVKLLLDKGADVSTQDKESKTPLYMAAKSGRSETVKLLLDKGADVSAQDVYGRTPIYMAAKIGSSETVKLLLNKGADVSTQDIFRKTPLHLAVESGSSETVKLLLERGADVSTQDDDGKAPLHLAAKSGRSETVKLLLDKGADVSAQDGYRRTPLYMAAMSGSSETVKLLLDKGDDVSTQDKESKTPLYMAAKSGRSETVKLLLDKGADGADVSTHDKHGATPLHLAATSGSSETVKLLLDKVANVSTQDKQRATPLHLAVESGSSETVKLLLNKGADVSTQDIFRKTPLHLAVESGSSETVKLLLERGADVSTQDDDGKAPLHLAAKSGRSETVKLLLDKGADVSAQDGYRRTPLYMAAMSGSSETVKLLLDKGADVSTQDKESKTPLYMAAKSGRSETVKLLLDKGADVSAQDVYRMTPIYMAAKIGSSETVKLLLNKGADLSTQDIFRKTPLHLAVESGSSETVKLLLERGADVSTQDVYGKTLLHLAAMYGSSETVKLLLDKGADLSTQDISGKTPLHLAAMYGSSETVKLLLDKGADVSTQDKESKTPLHLAATSVRSETVKLLLDKGADVSTQDKDGKTPLHLAVESGSSETVKLLLNKGADVADVSTQDQDGKTPVHVAATSGSSETVKLFLDKGADVSTQDKDSKTPLHLAAKSGSSETVKLLLAQGADVSTKDRNGDAPLHLAAKSGSSETVKLLLDHGLMYLHKMDIIRLPYTWQQRVEVVRQ
ncbi:uncharacterized protein [Haliotis cracherodii]|uniref:uncharacterized protein n=1 Tax=Haliotis cracherodii TaxID=6455 RepID=UPI0039E77F8C